MKSTYDKLSPGEYMCLTFQLDLEKPGIIRIDSNKKNGGLESKPSFRNEQKQSLAESERRCIKHKWVFDIKRDGTFKAWLVACGYSQIPGVDFADVYRVQ
jgi:hypothetical protein